MGSKRGAVAAVVQRATRGRIGVGALVVVHGARLPRWSALTVGGVSLVRAHRARSLICSNSPVLDGAFSRYVNN